MDTFVIVLIALTCVVALFGALIFRALLEVCKQLHTISGREDSGRYVTVDFADLRSDQLEEVTDLLIEELKKRIEL